MDSNEGQSSSNGAVPTSDADVRLLGPQEIRALAAELDITPTKKLGQNFVIDPNTVRRIVASAELAEDDHVIEIGPGLGSLTLALLEQTGSPHSAGSVTAVEIDGRLAARLPRTIAEFAPAHATALTVVDQDALTLSAADLHAAGLPAPTALVANLPYNVSVPVLLHLLHEFPSIRRVLVMVQLEVADRLAASPGSKIYGIPSVKAGFYGKVSKAGTIGKNVFWPAPKIDSGLVRIDRWNDADQPWREALRTRDTEEVRREVFAITDAAFLQRRKTLRAALSGYFGSGASAESVLADAGIDPKERGEKLGTGEFIELAIAALARKKAEN